jgi:hypothetical protein
MSKVQNELTKKFAQYRYPMSTGSDEWRDIKADFELEDDALGGASSYEYNNKPLGSDKLNGFKTDLEKFKERVTNYQPKDEVEKNEKETLLNKINTGLGIYQIMLS